MGQAEKAIAGLLIVYSASWILIIGLLALLH